uniref:hypothetical protein n=1 Tax=Megasphaera elsdenii TaxID=907 RepID=UPI0040290A2D
MIAFLYDFLHFYYNNINNISELKQNLFKDDFNIKDINLILNNLGKKVQININDIGNCYENEVIIDNNCIYFDSLEQFKN